MVSWKGEDAVDGLSKVYRESELGWARMGGTTPTRQWRYKNGFMPDTRRASVALRCITLAIRDMAGILA